MNIIYSKSAMYSIPIGINLLSNILLRTKTGNDNISINAEVGQIPNLLEPPIIMFEPYKVMLKLLFFFLHYDFHIFFTRITRK